MRKRTSVGTVFLEKYTNKKKLGKGAFGDVFLVQNQKGDLMALKMMCRRKLQGQNSDLGEYLEGEIKCMREVKERNMVELYGVEKDEDYYYMLMDYCDGGDLVNIQAGYQNMVFPLQATTASLAQVITGLEQIHSKGYLHRDIKPQNVLLKNQNNGDKVFKIADFGFAKRLGNINGTVLGTEQYMSPQIYRCGVDNIEQSQAEGVFYGYEVDMWAFGVLFYFMINHDFPFQLHPRWSIEEKHRQLVKQAENFSYRKAVMKTRRKIEENCTDDMEDLFKKIFLVDQQKRINFSEIRQHEIFRKYFKDPSQESQILYMNKFISKRFNNGKGKSSKDRGSTKKQIRLSFSVISQPDPEKNLAVEKEIIRLEYEEINFLAEMVNDFDFLSEYIDSTIILMVSYNMTKYRVLLLRKFLNSFSSSIYSKKHQQKKGLSWQTLFRHPDFIGKKKQYAKKLGLAESKLQELYKRCTYDIERISNLNQHFEASFSEIVSEEDQTDQKFIMSFRKSTSLLYSMIKKKLKTDKTKQLYFYLCVACICHVFSQFYKDEVQKEKIFETYLKQETKKAQIFSYERFVLYLKKSSKEVIVNLVRKLIQECMIA